MKKEMHGFTIFWIWSGIIMDLIMTIVAILYPHIYTSIDLSPNYIIFIGVLCFLGSILLLNFNIFGFWLLVICCVIDVFKNITNGVDFTLTLVGQFIGLAINFGILQLKKNGVSTWEHLTGKIKDDLKKCPYCANDIKKEAIICQFCGKNIISPENN